MKKRILSLLVSLTLAITLVVPVGALSVEDAKKLLQDVYVDKLSEQVLAAETLDELFMTLGDPYTQYMTAQEYARFNASVNGESLVGIGVSINRGFQNGYEIISLLPNSPAAESTLQAGDRIIAVDGIILTGEMDVVGMISGESGTQVTITVVRGEGQHDITLTRRKVLVPIVTFDKDGNIGVIDCISFGESTVEIVEQALRELEGEVSVWVMDLRNNPGGSAEAASSAAGLFVGSKTMVYFRDADGNYSYMYTKENCPDLTDKPLFVLLSPQSASGSELFAAAARDHGFGIGVGSRSFGKGIAQIILDESNTDELFDGDALKITASRFFSPDGTTNHMVGILPTLLVDSKYTDTIVTLLSEPEPARSFGYAKLVLAGQTMYLNLSTALTDENKPAFRELLQALPPSAQLYSGASGNVWHAITPAHLAENKGLSFTARTFSDVANTSFSREIDTLATYQLLSGYPDGTFRPHSTITRAEFCTMLANAFHLRANPSLLKFSDVRQDAWYADAVSAVMALGAVAGMPDGTFCPDANISYEQMLTIAAAVASWANMDAEGLHEKENLSVDNWISFHDYSPWAQKSAWMLDEMNALLGELSPTQDCTREVAAATLCALMEEINLLWD